MKKFDLKRMLAGEPIVCRNGLVPERIEFFSEAYHTDYPIVASINGYMERFTRDGVYDMQDNKHSLDLFMQDEEVQWEPFNLDCALAGDPVICRNFYMATDFHYFKNAHKQEARVYCVLLGVVYSFSVNGKFYDTTNINYKHPFDLFMLKKDKENLNV